VPDGGEAIVIHPGRQPGDELGPPGVRRCLRRRFLARVKEILETGLVDRALTLGRVVTDPLRVRWLGTVPYREALAVQTALFEHGNGQHLLLLEHRTCSPTADGPTSRPTCDVSRLRSAPNWSG
jgi:hypothetical protein